MNSKKNGGPLRTLIQFCFIVAFISVWSLLQFNIDEFEFSVLVPHQTNDAYSTENITEKGFLVDTVGCRIPDLNPWDPSIQKYVFDEKPLNCVKAYGKPPLVESNLTSVFVNETLLDEYRVTDKRKFTCCFTPFTRVEYKKNLFGNYPEDVDYTIKFESFCIPFNHSATIAHEFVRINCYFNKEIIYSDYHSFFPIKKKTNEQKKDAGKLIPIEGAVSVVLFGVDAVSRLNLYRQMPETLKFLKSKLNAIEMLGYNKVEDNTYPNLVPVLTGLSDKELEKTCWQKTHYVFDNCRFTWNSYHDIGYKTAFGEDSSWMGIFNYLKRGFRKQPTDYYMRVLNEISENKTGLEFRGNAYLCVGPRKALDTLLSYAYKFLVTLKSELSFGFFWGTSLSHDYVNLPKQGDMDHKHFLENLYKQGIFNNTIMVFMSDHGIRWGPIRETYQGYLEERLPFLFIVYPKWFGSRYTTAVSNLKRNAHRLITPFDLHELLEDLRNLSRLEKSMIRIRSNELVEAKPLPRGISLFLPIPGTRRCSDAGINDHWCTCHQSSVIATNDIQVQYAARQVLTHLNYLLRDFPQCAKLKLSQIMIAREEICVSHSNYKVSDVGIKDLNLMIETTPGKGMFEATVRYNGNVDKYKVVGTISRINLYGNQSQCMPKYKLRLYCYCIDHYTQFSTFSEN